MTNLTECPRKSDRWVIGWDCPTCGATVDEPCPLDTLDPELVLVKPGPVYPMGDAAAVEVCEACQ